MVTVLHLGKSSLPKKPITDDDVDRISLCLKVLSECSPLMNDIFNKECRKSLSHMLTVRLEEEKLSQKVTAVVSEGWTQCLTSWQLGSAEASLQQREWRQHSFFFFWTQSSFVNTQLYYYNMWQVFTYLQNKFLFLRIYDIMQQLYRSVLLSIGRTVFSLYILCVHSAQQTP